MKTLALLTALVGVACAVLFVLSRTPAYAHGSGLTFTATTTAHFVDVDYDSFVLESGTGGRFSFFLFSDAERTRPVEFERVWVRIVHHEGLTNDTIFSAWLSNSQIGTTGLTYRFLRGGSYSLIVRYSIGEGESVDASLPLTVERGVAEKSFRFSVEFWSGIALGLFLSLVAVAFVVLKRRLAP